MKFGTPPSGKSECPKNKSGHEWEFTGTTRPGKVWDGLGRNDRGAGVCGACPFC